MRFQKVIRFFRRAKKENFDSKEYWNHRYLNNGNSGSGSYGHLAEFKAEVLNSFVQKKNIKNVIELGCGDGNQLKLASYENYTGFDVSEEAITICRTKFKDDHSKCFYNNSFISKCRFEAELVLSLDVIFHLTEDKIYEAYMQNLFELSQKYVMIYSSNFDKRIAPHVRCRTFTNWVKINQKGKFNLISIVPNRFPFDKSKPNDTSFSDFFIYKKCYVE